MLRKVQVRFSHSPSYETGGWTQVEPSLGSLGWATRPRFISVRVHFLRWTKRWPKLELETKTCCRFSQIRAEKTLFASRILHLWKCAGMCSLLILRKVQAQPQLIIWNWLMNSSWTQLFTTGIILNNSCCFGVFFFKIYLRLDTLSTNSKMRHRWSETVKFHRM